MKNKNMYRVLTLLIIAGTLVAAVLILLLPLDFKPEERNEIIKDEVINRIKDIAEQRNSLSVISFTPFMWDEGYYFDKTANENLGEGKIKRKQLLEKEQRLIFFYKGQLIIDLVIDKDEIYFDIEPGQLEKDESLNIDSNSVDAIRLYE